MLPDSFLPEKTLLPAQTREVLKGIASPDNFYLKFLKAARWEEEEEGEGKFKFYCFREGKYGIKPDFGAFDFGAVITRQQKVLNRLGFRKAAENGTLETIEAATTWRMIVGLGNHSVYENGMTLHHVYGIPFIPGSGIKGMLRNCLINSCYGYGETAEETALAHPILSTIFGYGNQADTGGCQGRVFFFDTFPTEPPTIEPDVMNNHYQSYYEGKTPPADWINLNPIFFLSIKNTPFCFNLGIQPKHNRPVGQISSQWTQVKQPLEEETPEALANIHAGTPLLQFTAAWLKYALEEYGLGAKTAAGYGRFV